MTPVIATIVAGLIVAVSGYGGAKFARRKEQADAASIITATAMSLLAPLNIEVSNLSGRLATLESQKTQLVTRVASLEQDNRNLRSENTGLRDRVGSLERQLLELGHTPVNGTATTTTTVTTTSGDAA
jgi:FtsZ-binding cell division protein ZapB